MKQCPKLDLPKGLRQHGVDLWIVNQPVWIECNGSQHKNEETCRLARELAQLTGETMTGAITVALRERLERMRREGSTEIRVQRLLVIGSRCAGMLDDGPAAVEHGEFLYDEPGLPK